MRYLLAYIALVVAVSFGFVLEARYEEMKRSRTQLDAFKRRSRQ